MKKITPFLWFDGQAETAAKFYVSIFKNSKISASSPMSTNFTLDGLDFIALNGGPLYQFSPAVSFFVSCKTQKEIDYFWKKLSRGGKVMQCGWLTDKYGVTWQIIPDVLGKLIGDKDENKASRAMKAMLKMKKIQIDKLKKAHRGR